MHIFNAFFYICPIFNQCKRNMSNGQPPLTIALNNRERWRIRDIVVLDCRV